jgi:dihydropteroate synthase
MAHGLISTHMIYVRPLVQTGDARPEGALRLASGWGWFSHVELLTRGAPARVCAASDAPASVLARLIAPRAHWAGLSMDQPRLMGILNVTPDSFSDGGLRLDPMAAQGAALKMASEVDILDVGGESTRPGAVEVAAEEEIRRTVPVIAAMRRAGIAIPISIDTRKAQVAVAAMEAGATIVNDVSGLTYDPKLAAKVAKARAPVVIMHALATPASMQDAPHYDDVLLDVYDALAKRAADAVAAGIDPDRIVIDPGIGFGKTLAHNLALLRGMALFHGLGHPVLLGASRKRFIGTVAAVADPKSRMAGSIAVALAALAQGVQILRVHDTYESAQARALWQAVTGGEPR